MTRDEWRVCEDRFASRGIDMAAASRGAAFFSKMQSGASMTPDQLQRLTAARWRGEQALFTAAVAMLTERHALPDDLDSLVVDFLDGRRAQAKMGAI